MATAKRPWVITQPKMIMSVLIIVLATTLHNRANADPPGSIRLPDQKFYTSGSYVAYASPWSSYIDKSLLHERDFLDSIIVQPTTFPNGTRIEWRWPSERPRMSGVWGYFATSYGNYDGGNPELPVEPKQVKAIRTLSEDISWSGSGLSQYNILNEFYLTREAGRPEQKVIEIGLLLHPNSRRDPFFLRARLIGRYADAQGRFWRVVMNDPFCMFIPDNDVMEGRIDLRAMLTFLVDEDVITGSEWFNGLAIGVEPVWGQGSATIAAWKIFYD